LIKIPCVSCTSLKGKVTASTTLGKVKKYIGESIMASVAYKASDYLATPEDIEAAMEAET